MENLVGYAKTDLMVPLAAGVTASDNRSLICGPRTTPRRCGAARSTPPCTRRSARCPVQRLAKERELLRPLPSLRPEIGIKVISRKVDKLSCIRFGSARYSVPCRLIGTQVTITTTATSCERDRAGDR